MTSTPARIVTKDGRSYTRQMRRSDEWAQAHVACTFCDAVVGAPCVDPDGTLARNPPHIHVQRMKKAGRLAIEMLLKSDGVLYHEDDAADAMAAKATPTVLRPTPRAVHE
jgi:hypothetical protein